MKKIILILSTLLCCCTFMISNEVVKDTGKKDFSNTNAIELVKQMKTGWNLGNTFDATASKTIASEMSWGQPKTTKAMIDGLAKSGIKTLRIPVSWKNHIIDEKYTVDPKWMARVKEVVDWAMQADMYVILNSHHDDHFSPDEMKAIGGYYPNKANFDESKRFLEKLWGQICVAFNNGYDEHLVFESMNEPRLKGTQYEWWFDANSQECREAADCLNKLNQAVLDTIRKSGGNNKKRFVTFPGLHASPSTVLNDYFVLPKDDEKGKLIVTVHMYSPYIFAMQSPGATKYTPIMRNEIATTFKQLNQKFVVNGIPVLIDEYGATNKNNLSERVAWFGDFIKYSRQYGMTACVWDNGIHEVVNNDYSEHYGYYNRRTQQWYFPEILQAILDNVGK